MRSAGDVLRDLQERGFEPIRPEGELPNALKKAHKTGFCFSLIDGKVCAKASEPGKLEVYPLAGPFEEGLLPWSPGELIGDGELTSMVFDNLTGGAVIRVPRGQKVDVPLFANFAVSRDGKIQFIYTAIVVEDGAEATIVSGCAAAGRSVAGAHISATEIFLGEGAKLTYLMLHSWNERFFLYAKTSVAAQKGSTLLEEYITVDPVRELWSFTEAEAEREARVLLSSIVLAKGNSALELSSKAVLSGEGSSARIVSKIIAEGGSIVTNYGEVEGRAKGSFGRVECGGMLLSENASIRTVPALLAVCPESELSHEAFVGSISKEEINYLMSRGFSEEEAVSAITSGFLRSGAQELRLPPQLKAIVDRVLEKASKAL